MYTDPKLIPKEWQDFDAGKLLEIMRKVQGSKPERPLFDGYSPVVSALKEELFKTDQDRKDFIYDYVRLDPKKLVVDCPVPPELVATETTAEVEKPGCVYTPTEDGKPAGKFAVITLPNGTVVKCDRWNVAFETPTSLMTDFYADWQATGRVEVTFTGSYPISPETPVATNTFKESEETEKTKEVHNTHTFEVDRAFWQHFADVGPIVLHTGESYRAVCSDRYSDLRNEGNKVIIEAGPLDVSDLEVKYELVLDYGTATPTPEKIKTTFVTFPEKKKAGDESKLPDWWKGPTRFTPPEDCYDVGGITGCNRMTIPVEVYFEYDEINGVRAFCWAPELAGQEGRAYPTDPKSGCSIVVTHPKFEGQMTYCNYPKVKRPPWAS